MIYKIFSDALSQFPHRPALVSSTGIVYTYQELQNCVLKISVYLQKLNIVKGDFVGIIAKHEEAYPFFYLALNRMGVTYVPFDDTIPPVQIKEGSQKIGLKMILIEDTVADNAIWDNIVINRFNIELIDKCVEINLSSIALNAGDEFSGADYVVASSGASAERLWVPIDGKGLLYWADVEREELKLGPDDKILGTRGFAYDASISELMRAFAGGGSIYLLSKEQRRDLNSIIEASEKHNITCIILIASQLKVPNLSEWLYRFKKAGLQHLMVTGDACSLKLVECCQKLSIYLWNCYGPKEATFGMSILRVDNLPLLRQGEAQFVPVGNPNRTEIKAHIVDGELCIESPYLSAGYLGDAPTTERQFPSITVGGKSVRVFRTGDFCSQIGDYLCLHGESLHSKISGIKTSHLIIEACLLNYRDKKDLQPIYQACVVVKMLYSKAQFFAYVLISDEQVDLEHLSYYLRQHLNTAEIPILIKLPSLPRFDLSDKIDRGSLQQRCDDAKEYLFAQDNDGDKAEQNSKHINYVRALCGKLLGLDADRINPDRDLLFLGVTSIIYQNLVAEVQQQYPQFSYKILMTLNPINIRNIATALTGNIAAIAIKNRATVHLLSESYKKGEKNYFFFAPLLGEGYITYRNFAKKFQSVFPQYNLYGLSAASLLDESNLPSMLDEAAQHYWLAIKTIQPLGPYYFLGFSFGTILAAKTTYLLESNKEKVEELQFIDGFPPQYYQALSIKEHANLLLDLTEFVLQVIAGPAYGENIDWFNLNIDLCKLEVMDKLEQIRHIFSAMIHLAKNPVAILLLKTAERHLLIALQDETTYRLAAYAELYLSSSDQTYARGRDTLGLADTDPRYITYFWNLYCPSIKLAGTATEYHHLQLIQKQNKFVQEDYIDIFYADSNFRSWQQIGYTQDIAAPRPILFSEALSAQKSFYHFCLLTYRILNKIKKKWVTDEKVIYAEYPIANTIYRNTNNREGRIPDKIINRLYGLLIVMDPSHYKDCIKDIQIKEEERKTATVLYRNFAKAIKHPSQATPVSLFYNGFYSFQMECVGERAEIEVIAQNVFATARRKSSPNAAMDYYYNKRDGSLQAFVEEPLFATANLQFSPYLIRKTSSTITFFRSLRQALTNSSSVHSSAIKSPSTINYQAMFLKK